MAEAETQPDLVRRFRGIGLRKQQLAARRLCPAPGGDIAIERPGMQTLRCLAQRRKHEIASCGDRRLAGPVGPDVQNNGAPAGQVAVARSQRRESAKASASPRAAA